MFDFIFYDSRLYIELVFKVTLILLICLSLYQLFKNSSASIKVQFLRSTLGLLLISPIIAISLPSIEIGLLDNYLSTNGIEQDALGFEYAKEVLTTKNDNFFLDKAYKSHNIASYIFWLSTIWLIGLLVFIWKIFRQIHLTRKILVNAKKLTSNSALYRNTLFSPDDFSPIYISDEVFTPVVVGFINQTIIIPEDFTNWKEEKLLSSVLHEQAHIDNMDNLTRLISMFTCALYWFHPLVWFIFTRLKEEQEIAADNQVILKGIRASTYAKNLLDIVKSINGNDKHCEVQVTMGTYSFFPNRMKMILSEHPKREKITMKKSLAVFLTTAGLVMSISAATTAKDTRTSEESNKVNITYSKNELNKDERLLATAIEENNHHVFERLLEQGFKFRTSNHATFLKLAGQKGDVRMMNLLLESGLKVKSVKNNALLTSAIERSNRDMVELLLEAGAPVDKNSLGTLLEKAKKSGDNEIADLLISASSGSN